MDGGEGAAQTVAIWTNSTLLTRKIQKVAKKSEQPGEGSTTMADLW